MSSLSLNHQTVNIINEFFGTVLLPIIAQIQSASAPFYAVFLIFPLTDFIYMRLAIPKRFQYVSYKFGAPNKFMAEASKNTIKIKYTVRGRYS